MKKYLPRFLEKDGLEIIGFPDLEKSGIKLFFTTRKGGDSDQPYDSLNLAYHVGDDTEKVTANRKKTARALGFQYEDLIDAEQVHGDSLTRLSKKDAGTCVKASDAIMTSERQLPLMIMTADCLPVAVIDIKRGLISLVHAGRKGTLLNISGKTAKAMIAQGSKPGDLTAVLGPAIEGDCYPISAEQASAFQACPGLYQKKSASGDQYHLDLWEANSRQLERSGVFPERITIAGFCTKCHKEKFFSYRRDGVTGRQAAILWRE